ncbi:hypothetical protein BX600DRAFT_92582 [Xylariales sp. PMI_506]|nr:hypothetical protein BX600DRAFT_92582 [Xylariales sp. PMI_506]
MPTQTEEQKKKRRKIRENDIRIGLYRTWAWLDRAFCDFPHSGQTPQTASFFCTYDVLEMATRNRQSPPVSRTNYASHARWDLALCSLAWPRHTPIGPGRPPTFCDQRLCSPVWIDVERHLLHRFTPWFGVPWSVSSRVGEHRRTSKMRNCWRRTRIARGGRGCALRVTHFFFILIPWYFRGPLFSFFFWSFSGLIMVSLVPCWRNPVYRMHKGISELGRNETPRPEPRLTFSFTLLTFALVGTAVLLVAST